MTSSARQEHREGAELRPRPGLASRTGDPIDAWLTLLTSMLRMPESRASEIRDELEDHLRTRVRDQLVAGEDEHVAVRRAIDEVGEASAVAHQFRSAARTPIRRLVMNLSIIAVSAAALGLSVVAINGTPAQPSTYEASSLRIEGLHGAEITTDPTWSFEQFATHMGEIAGRPTFIHWSSLADAGIDRGDEEWTFDVEIEGASFETVMRLLNERVDAFYSIAARTHEGRLEFASREYFDRFSRRLVRYDITDIVRTVAETWNGDHERARTEIIDLIQTYVEADDWLENGGELASMRPVGNQLFIQAPERFFPKVEWLLAQLHDGDRPGEAEQSTGPVHAPLDDVSVRIEAEDPLAAMRALATAIRALEADELGMVSMRLDDSGSAFHLQGPEQQVQNAAALATALLDR